MKDRTPSITPSIAKMIDHSLLHPTLTDQDMARGCEVGKKYGVAAVVVKPYAVGMAAEILKGTDVAVCTVVGFPHGSSRIEVKVAEAKLACREGATELDMVVNLGKALSGDWDYVERELKAVAEAAHRAGAILKVIFENDFIDADEIKIKLCRACERAGADFVKTSTGFGFVQGDDGKYSYRGAREADLRLMRENCSQRVQVKAAGKVRTLDDVLKVRALGVTRVGATATEAILTEAEKRGLE